jgi:hypothetical protein
MLRRLSQLQKNFLKGFLSKVLMLPAFWFFFKAVYPLYAYPWIDPVIYIMLTLFDWLCLTLVLFASATLDIIITSIDLKRIFAMLHFRKDTHPTVSTADKSTEKEKKRPLY